MQDLSPALRPHNARRVCNFRVCEQEAFGAPVVRSRPTVTSGLVKAAITSPKPTPSRISVSESSCSDNKDAGVTRIYSQDTSYSFFSMQVYASILLRHDVTQFCTYTYSLMHFSSQFYTFLNFYTLLYSILHFSVLLSTH